MHERKEKCAQKFSLKPDGTAHLGDPDMGTDGGTILSRIWGGGVTTDEVWIGEWIYWPLTHDSALQALTTLSLIYTLYKSLHAKSSPACSVFISRCLVTTLNNGDSSSSVLMSLLSGEYPTNELPIMARSLHSLPCRNQLSTDWFAPVVFLITLLHGSSRKHRFQKELCCFRGVVTAPFSLFVSRSLLSNGSMRHNIKRTIEVGYRLDFRGIWFRFPGGAENFPSSTASRPILGLN
jgi:hypothetical protein